MKRKISFWYIIITIAVIAFLGILVGPFIYWNMNSESKLNVWMIDKTVPDRNYREHLGLTWLLKHEKIKNELTGDYFNKETDYYGFYPEKDGSYTTKELSEESVLPDLIYITDTYGVYQTDGYTPTEEYSNPELVYGGLNDKDIFSIKNNLGNYNTLIGEFNIEGDPTSKANTEELETLFGIEWLGWRGRYYNDLSKGAEVPEYLINQYETNNQTTWEYTKAGYVLISEEGMIAVLQEGIHIKKNGLTVAFQDQFQEEFQVPSETAYQYWFEFVTAKLGKETVAEYKMNLTEDGKKIMEELGLPSSFPAIIRSDSNLYRSYYFAGDFAELPKEYALWNYAGIEKINQLTSSFHKNSIEYFYWNCYYPVMRKIMEDITSINTQRTETSHPNHINVKTVDGGFQILRGDTWEDMFVKGVNIGAALPGRWFTEFPTEEETYYEWFEQIGEMNANTIRVYTLLPPQFYTALKYYNETHPEQVLWLFQEIWPEENPKDMNYLAEEYVKDYYKEIEYTINAVHGYAKIDKRFGRAYGIYTADVSSYVIGYLVGRELEPDEVLTTNQLNSGFTYTGEYISAGKDASATEAWLAMNCDYVVKYEAITYDWQHPAAIVSWPTLDITEHDSEWNEDGLKSLEYNDKVSVDINHIDVTNEFLGGFFGAYHIYPNYPDFMNNEPEYAAYNDEEGSFRYGGYLQQFIENHTKYPALVAEFGLATGMGNAHSNPDGYNHGGLSEEKQGEGIVRMMKAIEHEGYAGGLIFEWMDEWAKKTWITEPYMIPYDRHVFWHNAADPEQNYGILAMESEAPENSNYMIEGVGDIQAIELKQDETFLYITVTLQQELDFSKDHLYIGLDTYDRVSGEYRFNQKLAAQAPFGLEYLLDVNSENNSKLLVQPGYNISKGKYASYISRDGIFEEMLQLTNNESTSKNGTQSESSYQNGSMLRYGTFENNSYYTWYEENKTVYIRLPWTRINFSDPSEMRVLKDTDTILQPVRDEIDTIVTDGIMISAQLVDEKAENTIDIIHSETPYHWDSWTEPEYSERLKESYYIIQDYFKNLQ